MLLTSVKLENFRSYQKSEFNFSAGTTVILGANAAGKTNLLEAIGLLATGKSFRADRDSEAVAWGSEYGRVTGLTGDDKIELLITSGSVGGQPAPIKRYFVNGVARRLIDFAGKLRVVLFWPEHLELVTDSPSLRRRYLDSVLTQVDREYYRSLLSYERGLRQRNRLLDLINEGKAGRNQLLFWDQLLVKAGGYITDKRAEFIEFVNHFQPSAVRGQPENVYRLTYDKSVISDSRLAQYADEEVAAKATLVGPHRDDFLISKIQSSASLVELSKFGSRGEQRLAILELKLAELAYIQEQSGERPVLLLDDIFSELDAGHRRLVMDLVAKQQTVMTSAESDIIEKLGLADVKLYEL